MSGRAKRVMLVSIFCLGFVTLGIIAYIRSNEEARLNRRMLDVLTSAGGIDRVEVMSGDWTNVLTGAAAQSFVQLLSVTNRIAKADLTKSAVLDQAVLIKGTNEIGRVTHFENGLWKFGQYSFRLKTRK